uniref:Uncharacterized protein n=1 Tax=Timema douglasi TaxID=61478 RepID=A0A7R8VHR3_TIMDO|nr:unnamed protein product [Timema douglasi]
MASLVLTDSSQLTSDSQHLGNFDPVDWLLKFVRLDNLHLFCMGSVLRKAEVMRTNFKWYMKKLNNELVSWSQLGAERRTNKKKAKLDLATSTLELNLANCHEFLTDDDKRSISMTVDCRDILKTYEDMKDMAAVNAHLKHKMKHRTKCLLDRVDAAIAVTKADICHKDDPD